MHQTLYLTYRPTDFSQVIGQDHVIAALTAAVRKNKVAHAYLFTGPRGTGKTTVGRLLSKAVNCEQASSDQIICGECAACKSISEGRSLDIIEIDAASNRGIDDIRALRERVSFPPQELARKVYIIDEVHMLTSEAFNALLKTLEEPPAHVLFILATTEPHKVPITIQSRCQRLDFHRGTHQDLIKNLRWVAKQEGVEIVDEALDLVAELAEGGYRDSLTLLERVLSSDGEVTAARVRELFGLGDEELIQKLILNLMAGSREPVFTVLAEAESKGVNPPYLAQMVVYRLRHLLYAKVGAVAADQWEIKAANAIDLTQLRELLEYWMKAAIDSHHSPVALLPLEIAAAKWLEKFNSEGTAKIIADPQPTVADQPTVTAEPKLSEVEIVKKPVEIKVEVAPEDKPATKAGPGTVTVAVDAKQWEEVVDILTKHNHSISKLLQTAAIGRLSEDKLPIYVQYAFHRETLAQKGNYEAIAGALQTVLKQTVIPDIKTDEPPKDAMRLLVQAKPADGDLSANIKDVFL